MNRIIHIIGTLAILIALIGVHTPLRAQEDAASEQVRKAVDKLMSEMPIQDQLEVLKFAQRQQAEAQRTAKQTPTSTPATPAPQSVAVKPQPNQQSAATPAQPAQPAQPTRPDYIEQAEAMKTTTVDWGEINHDFGEITTGEVVKHVYRFTNTGSEPLTLTRVKASCGCTTPSWSKEPIQPGAEGFIEVAFNTRGKKGPQRKTVVVNGNFDPVTQILRFQGEIVTPEIVTPESDQ
jgi:hypothetical protein